MAGLTKNARNSVLASHVAKKIGELTVESGRVEFGIGHHLSKGKCVAGNKGPHLVVTSLARAIGRYAGHELANESAVGLRCQFDLLR